MKALIAAAVALGAAGAASAQTAYSLGAGSLLLREFCLPPCLCPQHEESGPVAGTFTLTLLDSNPLFTRYRLTDIRWRADLGAAAADMTGNGVYTIGGEEALLHRLELDLTIGPLAVITSLDSGLVPVDPSYPFPAFRVSATTGIMGCRRDTLWLTAAPGCYANCDQSTSAPALTVGDFTCFLARYAAGDPYANCDHSTAPPVLNTADFTCFVRLFAAGCG